MDESESNAVRELIQPVSKPVSVTVFGVFNCVFGGLGLIYIPLSLVIGIWSLYMTMQLNNEFAVCSAFMASVNIVFSIWMIILGVGLLKMKKRARRGAVMFSAAFIVWLFIAVIANIVMVFIGWVQMDEGRLYLFIFEMYISLCSGLVYPILLLIFMKTPKVKSAFAAKERIS